MNIEAASENLAITRAQAMRAAYRLAMQDEISVGANADEATLNGLRMNHPSILAYKKRVLGGGGPVTNYADWIDFFVADYGPRAKCLSLGSGIGRVEKYLVAAGFTEQMETYELCAGANESIRLKDPKINTLAADLNFVQLEPDSFDFILCHGVLHHLINLEHVLYAIDRALKRDGILLVYEYVGESRWQFSQRRLTFLRENFPAVSFRVPKPYTIHGFESVRSGELLDLLRAQFRGRCERSACYGGVYFPFLICANRGADELADRVIELDERVAREESLSPCYHMGLYRKSDRPATPARCWSDSEVDSRLNPWAPPLTRVKRAILRSRGGWFVRRVKRIALSSGHASTQ